MLTIFIDEFLCEQQDVTQNWTRREIKVNMSQIKLLTATRHGPRHFGSWIPIFVEFWNEIQLVNKI